MTSFEIVALYAALNLLLAPVLMIRIGQVRLARDINIGDGGNEALNVRIRTHGNFAENAPLALMGLFALAMLGAAQIALHIFGAGFFIGRLLHAHGMAQPRSMGKARMIGMMLTLIPYLGMAIYLLILIFTKSTA